MSNKKINRHGKPPKDVEIQYDAKSREYFAMNDTHVWRYHPTKGWKCRRYDTPVIPKAKMERMHPLVRGLRSLGLMRGHVG